MSGVWLQRMIHLRKDAQSKHARGQGEQARQTFVVCVWVCGRRASTVDDVSDFSHGCQHGAGEIRLPLLAFQEDPED